MSLSWNKVRDRAASFAGEWAATTKDERDKHLVTPVTHTKPKRARNSKG